MNLNINGKGLLIHHWDVDGICSTALILNHLKPEKIHNFTPQLGAFYLSEKEIQDAQTYDYVIIVDMALPINNITEIAKKTSVTVIDHHHQDIISGINHINPIAGGESTDRYPATSWVVREHFDLPLSLHSILGILGDREEKIKQNQLFWEIISDYIKKNETSFKELMEIVYRIDSNYKVGDKNGVEEAPHLLNSYSTSEEILKNGDWLKKKLHFDKKLKEVLLIPPENVNDVLIKRLNTKYSIISTVTRKIAWGSGKNSIVVNTGYFQESDQLYVRSNRMNMLPLIKKAKELGFNAGGKEDVLGAIIPKNHTEKFIEEILNFFE